MSAAPIRGIPIILLSLCTLTGRDGASSVIALANLGSAALALQITAYSWDDASGRVRLTAARDPDASPFQRVLAPGTRGQVHVGFARGAVTVAGADVTTVCVAPALERPQLGFEVRDVGRGGFNAARVHARVELDSGPKDVAFDGWRVLGGAARAYRVDLGRGATT